MQLSEEQHIGKEAFLEGKNVFITGDAGTGKSTLVQSLCYSTDKNIALLAPTGVAALNISGSTIHRFFKFPLGILNGKGFLEHLKEEVIETINATDIFILDEISMVRADLLEAIDITLREYCNMHKPFGGKQIVVVGDFQQLAPVVTNREKDAFESKYKSPYAFDTAAWYEADFTNVYLTKSFRQDGDMQFIKYLNMAKKGNPYVVDLFNETCIKPFDDKAITLCSTNKISNEINLENLGKLKTKERTFEACIIGDVKPSDFPTEKDIPLKEGARVMMIINDPRFRFCNGDLGTVNKIYSRGIGVSLDNGEEVVLQEYNWDICEYISEGGKLQKKTVGTFSQLPIKLGWAVTIHKAQGKTLPSLNLELGNGCFCHGQLYVALSRATALSGINIAKKLKQRDLIIDQRIKKFYKSLANV